MYEVGQVIEMISMPDDPDPILAGTRGTVRAVQRGFRPGELVLSVAWDNGRTLNVITPPDVIKVVSNA